MPRRLVSCLVASIALSSVASAEPERPRETAAAGGERVVFVAAGLSLAQVDPSGPYNAYQNDWVASIDATGVVPHRHVGLHVELGRLGASDDGVSKQDAGIRIAADVVVYPWRVFDGPFLAAGFAFDTAGRRDPCYVEAGQSGMTCSDPVHLASPRASVGWHATLRSGVSIAISGGAAVVDNNATPTAKVQVGYAF